MKKHIKKILSCIFLSTILLNISGCSKEEKGSVYYLNFKPEVADKWEEIAQIYEEETGVEVKILTAGSGSYRQALKSELAKRDMPTLFQGNGPVGYLDWKNYCEDLSDTNLYSWLLDKGLAITDGDGVYGIPYVVEGFGIIYNEEIMQKYFSLPNKAVEINSTSEIKNFDTLKKVVEDMTLNKNALGIEGVFGSTSFGMGEDWRWQTHLPTVAIDSEFKDKNVNDLDEVDFSYSNNFKNIFDLYINNSCTDKSNLASKTVTNSMEEFALGKVAMVQNGNWAWSQISSIEGNIVSSDKIKYLPIYTGIQGEETQGLCIGTENYFHVNSKASEADKKATIDFLEWLFSSEKGKYYITNEFGFISPFETFEEDEIPVDPLANEVYKYMEREDLRSVNWISAYPDNAFREKFGRSLLGYVKETKDWESVVQDFKSDWKAEKSKE